MDRCQEAMSSLKRSSPSTLIVLLAFTSMMMVSKVKVVHGAGLRPSQCRQEERLSVNACSQLVYGQTPSPACCARIRIQHLECVCPAISPKLASLFNVNQVITLFKYCGRRVPRHFKCGSLYFP